MFFVKLSPKGKKRFQVTVSLPKSVIELKDHCAIHPEGLFLTDEEMSYAKDHGFDLLVKDGLLIVEERKIGAELVKPAVYQETKLAPVKATQVPLTPPAIAPDVPKAVEEPKEERRPRRRSVEEAPKE